MPDLLAMKEAKSVFLELKVGRNKPSKLQEYRMSEIEKEAGVRCFVVYSVTEVEAVLKIYQN